MLKLWHAARQVHKHLDPQVRPIQIQGPDPGLQPQLAQAAECLLAG